MNLFTDDQKLIMSNALKHFGRTHQTHKAIEELSELTTELCHLNDDNQDIYALISEYADVQIMMFQLLEIYEQFFGDADVESMVKDHIEFKLNRLKGIIDANTTERISITKYTSKNLCN